MAHNKLLEVLTKHPSADIIVDDGTEYFSVLNKRRLEVRETVNGIVIVLHTTNESYIYDDAIKTNK